MLRTIALAFLALAAFRAPALAQQPECLAYRVEVSDFARSGIGVDEGLASVVEVLERRLSELGVAPPTAARLGEDVVVVRLPVGFDIAKARTVLGRSGDLAVYLVERIFPTSELAVMLLGPGNIALPSAETPGTSFLLDSDSVITGSGVAEAKVEQDAATGMPVIAVVLKAEASAAFERATKANVGAQFAIAVDGVVISAPTLQEPITGGRVHITGAFTAESANELALLLRSGALPARLVLLGEGAAACIP